MLITLFNSLSLTSFLIIYLLTLFVTSYPRSIEYQLLFHYAAGGRSGHSRANGGRLFTFYLFQVILLINRLLFKNFFHVIGRYLLFNHSQQIMLKVYVWVLPTLLNFLTIEPIGDLTCPQPA